MTETVTFQTATTKVIEHANQFGIGCTKSRMRELGNFEYLRRIPPHLWEVLVKNLQRDLDAAGPTSYAIQDKTQKMRDFAADKIIQLQQRLNDVYPQEANIIREFVADYATKLRGNVHETQN